MPTSNTGATPSPTNPAFTPAVAVQAAAGPFVAALPDHAAALAAVRLPCPGGDVLVMRASYRSQRFSRHAHENYALGVIEAGALAFRYRGQGLVATAVLAPLVRLTEGKWPGLSRRGLVLLCGQTFCGSFLFTVCLLFGLTLTGAAQAGVVAASTPAAVALIGRLVFRERLSRRAGLGLAATVTGLIVLGTAGGPATGPAPLLGDSLVLAAVVCEAVFLLLRRVLPDPLSPLAAALWVSLLGLALFLVPGLIEAASLDPSVLTPARWAALTYYGVGVTAVAYLLWFYGVVRVEAALAGAMTGIMPMAALGCAAWLCGERVTVRDLAGCAGVLAGILLLAGRKTQASGNAAALPDASCCLKPSSEDPSQGRFSPEGKGPARDPSRQALPPPHDSKTPLA